MKGSEFSVGAPVGLDAPPGNERSARWAVVLISAVLIGMVAHRLFLYFGTEFPINDGGLFYAFVDAIGRTFPGLPHTVEYNGLDLPLSYPPLSFWLVALLTNLGVDTLTMFHLAPILMNIAYAGLFGLVLRRRGHSLMFVGIALLFFCTFLRSFEWLVMGGGISRGTGALFLMATLLAVGVPSERERTVLPIWRLVLAGVAVAGAILSHIEWGLNAAACVVLARALGCNDFKHFVRDTLVAGLTALLLITPWLFFLYQTHGIGPLLAASSTSEWGGESFITNLLRLFVWSIAVPMIGAGWILLLRHRRFFWPGFFLICMLLTPRHAETPFTLSFAVFAATGTLWLYERLTRGDRSPKLAVAATTIFVCAAIGVRFNAEYLARGNSVHALAAPQLQAMDWVARHHPKKTFIVFNKYGWWHDSSAEWFPVLTGAHSINTVQGREWIPGSYKLYFDRDRMLKRSKNCDDVMGALAAYERPQFYWTEVYGRCFHNPRFRLIYRNDAVEIFQPI